MKIKINHFSTDEEELAKETEWIRVKSRNTKERKMDTSLSPPHTNKEQADNQCKSGCHGEEE
ncbi:hypothetical protein LSTR_LSTR004270 [Laodelphax striatellus]|uniref:Uncharacterized protein n=1 Tax=Laodelphax striatellus TaxID=195883 RepID=A0A482WH63_LAOST|nr:hypothetical protein LSTR_LSTR004270 [Laodelphax striatellus]